MLLHFEPLNLSVKDKNSVHYCTYEREICPPPPQRIGTSTRRGGPDELRLERYVEALQDPTSGLTYPALTGQRKQSVTDVERLFGSDLLLFMKDKGYETEVKYIEAVLGWRRACDQRGLSELQRCRYNYNFLNYILDELMPWHETDYDFSLLEVNRYIISRANYNGKGLAGIILLTKQPLQCLVFSFQLVRPGVKWSVSLLIQQDICPLTNHYNWP